MRNTIRYLFALVILVNLSVNICFAIHTTQQQTKANQTKQARSNFNEPPTYTNQQQLWNPNNRFELATFLPSILFFGFLILAIPLCLSLFAPFLFGSNTFQNQPFYNGYVHGRRKREIQQVATELNRKAKSIGLIDKDIDFDSLMPSASTILNTVITNLGKSIQKFNQ